MQGKNASVAPKRGQRLVSRGMRDHPDWATRPTVSRRRACITGARPTTRPLHPLVPQFSRQSICGGGLLLPLPARPPQVTRAEGAKDILFDNESRRKMFDGINKVADAVSATLGPRGECVWEWQGAAHRQPAAAAGGGGARGGTAAPATAESSSSRGGSSDVQRR